MSAPRMHPQFFLFQFIPVPLTSFLSPLAVIAVFWLLSRCHEETTTIAPLCQSTSLPEECLLLWRGLTGENATSCRGSWILSQAAVLWKDFGLPFPGWWRSLSTRLVVPRHSLPLGLISRCKLLTICSCSGERSICIFGCQLFIQTFVQLSASLVSWKSDFYPQGNSVFGEKKKWMACFQPKFMAPEALCLVANPIRGYNQFSLKSRSIGLSSHRGPSMQTVEWLNICEVNLLCIHRLGATAPYRRCCF